MLSAQVAILYDQRTGAKWGNLEKRLNEKRIDNKLFAYVLCAEQTPWSKMAVCERGLH